MFIHAGLAPADPGCHRNGLLSLAVARGHPDFAEPADLPDSSPAMTQSA